MRNQRIITPLLPIACCLIGGILIGRYFLVSEWVLLVTSGIVLAVTLLLDRHPKYQTACIWLMTVLFGMIIIQYPLPDLMIVHRAAERMLSYREQLLDQYLQQGIDKDEYAVIAAMTLGDKSALTTEVREIFNITGAGHILAISGLHLGILYMTVSLLARGLRLQTITQTVTILLIWAFAFLVGLSPSVVRSAIMLTIYGLLSLGYRKKMSINVLAFTAIVLLVIHPQSLFDIGFQMSFTAVLAILIFFPILNRLFSERWLMEHQLVRWLWGMTAVSISAQLGVAPLIAFYFHRFSTYFIISNFIVLPCAYLILIGAVFFFLTHWSVPVSILINVTSLMNHALTALASLPCASIEGLYPNVAQTVLIYFFMLLCTYSLNFYYLCKPN